MAIIPVMFPPARGSQIGVNGTQSEPFHSRSWPVLGEAAETALPWRLAMVGLGYVPVRSPPAAPLGGRDERVAQAAVPATTVRIWPVLPMARRPPVPLPVPRNSCPLAVNVDSTSAAVR